MSKNKELNINKELVEHLAELARMKLGDNEDEQIEDLKEILDYFEELKEVDTENVKPMTGGTFLKNKMREDKCKKSEDFSDDSEINAFPEKSSGYLKVPNVFK